jgi:hypothetical protein
MKTERLWVVYFKDDIKHVIGQKGDSQEKGGVGFPFSSKAHRYARAWVDTYDNRFYVVTPNWKRIPKVRPENWYYGEYHVPNA